MATILSAVQEGDILASSISDAVHKAIEDEIERQVQDVADKVRVALRGEIGRIAGQVLQHFDYTMRAQQIIITVDTRGLKEK